jgi:hypothetical protein
MITRINLLNKRPSIGWFLVLNDKRSAIAVLVLVLSFTAAAQDQNTQSQLTLSRLKTLTSVGLYNSVDQIAPDSKVVGSPYLNDDWRSTNIILNGNENINNYLVKYNIHSDMLEIKVNDEVRGLEGNKVKSFSFVLADQSYRTFLRASNFESVEELSGFVEVLEEGKIALLKKLSVTIIRPDYSVQLNVGSRDTRIVQKETFYYSDEKSIWEVPTSKKKLLKLFEDQKDRVSEFIETNNINLKNEDELRSVFSFYNNLD